MAQEKIVLFEADIDTDQAVKDTIKLKEELELLKAQSLQAKEKQGELSSEYIKYQAAIKSTQAEIKTQENLTQKLTGANTEQAGTITKLTAENAKLRQEQKGLNLETKEGIKRNTEINSKINDNTEFIKKNSDASTQNKMSISGYTEALDKIGGKFGGVISGFMGMVKAAWAFIATPIGAILGAIVVVVTAMVGIFKKFEPLIEWFEQKIAAVTAVFNVFKDALLGFLNGSKSLSESFSNLGSSMSEAAKRAIELKKAQQQLEDQQNLLIESQAKAKRQIDELLLQSKNRSLSEKERIELIDKALKIEEEAYNKKKKLADDEYAQKVEDIAINNQLTEEQKKNLQEQGAAYLQLLQQTKGINDEEVKEFAELSAKREEVLNESISIREKAMNRQDALAEKLAEKEAKRIEKAKADAEKKAEEENKAFEKAKAESEKLNEQYLEADKQLEEARRLLRLEAFDKGKEDRKLQREWEKEQQAIDFENEYILADLNNQLLFDLDREALNRQYAEEKKQAEKNGANISLIDKKYKAAQAKIDKVEIDTKLSLMSGFAGNLATIFGKQSGIGKAAAAAQVAVDTIKGAIAAYTSLAGIPFVGIPLGIAAAAAVTATGVKAEKEIWAVKSGLPESSSGGSQTISAPTSTNASIGQGIAAQNAPVGGGNTVISNQPTLVIDQVTQAQLDEQYRRDTEII